ncbi:MAG: hypothetical protein H7177_16020 [Rhizobacter sp.]|nr:hypothetical protein [Bacteriovorax sp.]
MGAKKLPTCVPAPKAKTPAPQPDQTIQKAEIERMKKLLSEKIKNPELARKAAMIISEMLNKK